jgi:mannose-6-phosphate isomerase-like protein (cupin superfamily)
MVVMEHTDIRAAAAAAVRARLVLVEREAPRRGVMPPLHAHAGDAQYEVLTGELTFYVRGAVVRATPGDVVGVPAGDPHTLRVETDGARWTVTTRVASPARFEDLGLALSRPVDEWPSEEELAALEAIAGANGIRILGPPGRLP